MIDLVSAGSALFEIFARNKEKKTPLIKEITKEIISPLLLELSINIKSLKSRSYAYDYKNNRPFGINQLYIDEEYSEVFDRFREDQKELSEEIDKFNSIIEKLNAGIRELANAIMPLNVTSKFETMLQKCVSEWDNDNPNDRLPAGEKTLFLKWVIDNKKDVLDSYTKFKLFWDIYGSEILKIREEENVSKKIRNLYEDTNNALIVANKIDQKLRALKSRWKSEYNLTEEDMKSTGQYTNF